MFVDVRRNLGFWSDRNLGRFGAAPKMSKRTVPQKVSEFLIQRQGRVYCNGCIQERLGLKWLQQVQLITATLAVTGQFERNVATCCTCHETKQATTAVRQLNLTGGSVPGSSAI